MRNFNKYFYTFLIIYLFAGCSLEGNLESLRKQVKKDNTFTVTFNTNGGSAIPSQSVASGGKVTQPLNPARASHGFNAWYKEAGFQNRWNFEEDIVTQDMTLHARWVLGGYTVIYDANGGVGEMPSSNFVIGVFSPLQANAFTWEGMIFAGWSSSAGGDIEYADSQTVRNLVPEAGMTFTLYAVWGINTYTVGYDANGGDGMMPPAIVAAGGSLNLAGCIYTRTGYTFTGWNSEADGQGTAYTDGQSVTNLAAVGETFILYAQWKPNTYTVEYDKNAEDAAGETANSAHVYDVEKALTANGFTRTSYSFASWNTQADGEGEIYADGESVVNLSAADGGTVILFAQWTAVPVNSVSLNKQSLTLTVGENETLIATVNPTDALNKNVSWESSASGIASVDETGNVTAIATGTAVITVTTQDGGKTAECEVTVNEPTVPVISINSHPNAAVNLTALSISGNLNVTASVTMGTELSYRWYSNTSAVNTGGIAIEGETEASFTIPKTLMPGTHYYFCEVSATGGAATVRSNVATVNVAAAASGLVETVWVPGGSFELGRNLGTGGGNDVTPVSTVTLTGFYMGKYQVTRAQYQAVMTGNTNGINANNPDWSTAAFNTQEIAAGGGNMNQRPVTHVSWYEAMVFCNRLSMQEGLTPAYRINGSTNPDDWGAVPIYINANWIAAETVSGSAGYRLPTEAQWEYAAKGGNNPAAGFTYSGSDNPLTVAWYSANSGSSPRMVGILEPNVLGIYDMSGNVCEWCWDWWESYTSDAKTDPTGASSGTRRIYRGGSWYDTVTRTRSVDRFNSYNPHSRNGIFGFRLARP